MPAADINSIPLRAVLAAPSQPVLRQGSLAGWTHTKSWQVAVTGNKLPGLISTGKATNACFPVVVQVKPLTDTRQRNKRNGSCLISATASSWIRNRINTALLKKGKERKIGNPLKDSGGFLEQRSNHHVEGANFYTYLDITGIMFCVGLFCTIALSWTIPTAGIQTC